MPRAASLIPAAARGFAGITKFPAVNNREFVNADQGIDSGYQGRPPEFRGAAKIRPGARKARNLAVARNAIPRLLAAMY